MTVDDEAEIVALMRAARAKARGYADYFGWSPNRDLEELGVATALAESLHGDGALFFSKLRARGRGNDPPDCEAVNPSGDAVAIEVTELVDPAAIRAYRAGARYDWADWDRAKFHAGISTALVEKDGKFPHLKGGPYAGGYVVIIHTDEPVLSFDVAAGFLTGHSFSAPTHVSRAYLLFSYDPAREKCPYMELRFEG
jgi:hypothetical protein